MIDTAIGLQESRARVRYKGMLAGKVCRRRSCSRFDKNENKAKFEILSMILSCLDLEDRDWY